MGVYRSADRYLLQPAVLPALAPDAQRKWTVQLGGLPFRSLLHTTANRDTSRHSLFRPVPAETPRDKCCCKPVPIETDRDILLLRPSQIETERDLFCTDIISRDISRQVFERPGPIEPDRDICLQAGSNRDSLRHILLQAKSKRYRSRQSLFRPPPLGKDRDMFV